MMQRHINDAEISEETRDVHLNAVSAEFEVFKLCCFLFNSGLA